MPRLQVDGENAVGESIDWMAADEKKRRLIPLFDERLHLGGHWVPCLPCGSRAPRMPHPPCDGCLCGGSGLPCMSELRETMAPLGLQPLSVPLDGDCFVHSALALMGVRSEGPAGFLHRVALRGRLADWLVARKHCKAWQRAVVMHGEAGLAAAIGAKAADKVLAAASGGPSPAGARDVGSAVAPAAKKHTYFAWKSRDLFQKRKKRLR